MEGTSGSAQTGVQGIPEQPLGQPPAFVLSMKRDTQWLWRPRRLFPRILLCCRTVLHMAVCAVFSCALAFIR